MHMPRLDPRIHAAALVLAVVTAGAVSGSAIGSTPMLQRGLGTQLPEAPRNAGVGDFVLDARKPPPNHYPLVTPTGTIPVAELARHGRLRGESRAFGSDADRAMLGADYRRELSDAEIDRLGQWQPGNARAVLAESAVAGRPVQQVPAASPQSRGQPMTRAARPVAVPETKQPPGFEEIAFDQTSAGSGD